MNAHELLEMASLDAMGLLDTDEREAFERAFRAAPPALQAQVRREQTRLTNIDGLLPAVEAPLGLRARVMAAVRDAMAQVAMRSKTVAGVIPALRPVLGVNRLWRTAAIGCAAAVLVLTFFTLYIENNFRDLSKQFAGNAVSDSFRSEFGPRFDRAFFDPNTRFISLAAPTESADRGKAVLLFDPTSGKGQFFVKGVEQTPAEYELVLIDAKGAAVPVASFRGPGLSTSYQTIEKLDLEGIKKIAIRHVGEDKFLLIATL
jgi:hypothetical protein